jgi:hypothetical protein
MQELKNALCSYLQDEAVHFAGDGDDAAETAEAIIDTARDAGWLPPDEVRNESADLQLAAIRLVKALHGRLVMQTEPPLVPLFMALAEAVEPYYETIGLAPYRTGALQGEPAGACGTCGGTREVKRRDRVLGVPWTRDPDSVGVIQPCQDCAPAVAGRRAVPEVDTARMLELLGPRCLQLVSDRPGVWSGSVVDGDRLVPMWTRSSPSLNQVLADLMAWLEAGG